MRKAQILTAMGLMSGTSMDGIDIAVIDTDGENIRRFGPARTYPYPAELRRQLGELVAKGESASEEEIKAAEWALTDAHGNAILRFFDEARVWGPSIHVIGFHGHTIWHRPDKGLTRQIGDGRALALGLSTDVVFDFRSADMVNGGQGAPLVPLYHKALALSLPKPVAILNLGGVGNVTWLGERERDIVAFDTGPGNALVDDWVRARTGRPFDQDGALALAGTVQEEVLGRLMDNSFFRRRAPKSLDRNDFAGALEAVVELSVEDGAATLAAFTVEAVARALDHLPQPPTRWLVCGGGRHNRFLMQKLSQRLGVPVEPVEAVGWQGDALEAQAFAFLAVRHLRGLPLSVPQTTGCKAPTPGGQIAFGRELASWRYARTQGEAALPPPGADTDSGASAG